MEEKTGRERNEAIKQINDDEELREIAREDPDAILLHDPEGSVITTAGGYGCYKNSEEFKAMQKYMEKERDVVWSDEDDE